MYGGAARYVAVPFALVVSWFVVAVVDVDIKLPLAVELVELCILMKLQSFNNNFTREDMYTTNNERSKEPPKETPGQTQQVQRQWNENL